MSDETFPSVPTKKAKLSDPAPVGDAMSVSEYASAMKLEKWQVAALLGRNVASGMNAHTKMSKEEFEKALSEALLGPV